jgi:hypothetical protein
MSEAKQAGGKAVTAKDNKAVASAAAYDYGQDVGAGFENQTNEDWSIPFLEILQPGSPEVQGSQDGTIRAGMIINKSTQQLTPGATGIMFVPAYTRHVFVEWVPRDQGGGYVGEYELTDPLVAKVRAEQKLGTYRHPASGNDLIETFYVYGVSVNDEGAEFPAVIAMSSTKIKPYKDWMFTARSIVITMPDGSRITKVPLFAHKYRLKTVFVEKNNYKWQNWVITFDGANAAEARLAPDHPLYLAARSVKEAVVSGAAKADTSNLNRADTAPSGGEGGSGPAAPASQEKPPF